MSDPEVSIVIPTHNRCASLFRLLGALTRQDFPAERMEVVVVADGCTDDTHAALDAFQAPYRLRVIHRPGQGPSHARNAGAATARGALLVFIDDDIEPVASLVSSHVGRHRAAPSDRYVQMGYYPTQISSQTGFYAAALATWWEQAFDAMAAQGHRFTYSNTLAGNLSLRKAFFDELGGFSTEFPHPGGEDYEFGIRLAKRGAIFGFSRAAMGLHYETSDIRRSMRRKHIEGVSDICMARAHPDVAPRLRLCWPYFGMSERIVRWAAFHAPWLSRFVIEAGLAGTRLSEAIASRRLWLRLCYLLLNTDYWLGVAEASGSPESYRRIVAQSHAAAQAAAPRVLELNLEDGIEHDEALLDAVRPAAIVLRLDGMIVAEWGAEPGAENFHAGHLRPLLASHCAASFAIAKGVAELRRERELSTARVEKGQDAVLRSSA